MIIRATQAEDISSLENVLKGTGLFPSEILREMLDGYLTSKESEDIWFTGVINNEAVGFCYAVPEKLADATWNMLAIAVLPSQQSIGLGKAIVERLERHLRDKGQRILIAETSSADQFQSARLFYENAGYTKVAQIRDFWATGDDKIIFWKAL